MRRHSAAQRGASSPTMSSGERGTHSSEWEGTPPLRRERHAHRWPSGWGEQCWLYQQRALGSGTLIPQNEWTFRRSEGSGILIGNPLMRGVMLALPITSSGERRTHSSEWEGTQTLSRERHAHRKPSIVRGAMLARPARRATYHRALRSGELIPQNEWELRRSAGSGMLKGDPLTRGAMLALPITSSGEWRTHSSEWKDTQPLRRERHTHR